MWWLFLGLLFLIFWLTERLFAERKENRRLRILLDRMEDSHRQACRDTQIILKTLQEENAAC